MNLTKRSIEALACPAGRASAIFYDDYTGGLAVRVTRAGVKTWVLRYRTQAGTDRLTKLARCDVFSPDQARTEARRLLGLVAGGGDPGGDRATARGEATVKELGEAFLSWVKIHRKPTTWLVYDSVWRNHVLPAFGARRHSEVTVEAVERLHGQLAGHPVTANYVVVLLTQIWKRAMKSGAMKRGAIPFREVEMLPKPRRRRRVTTEELRAIWGGLDSFDAMPSFAPLVRLLLLTGCRINEWRRALWSWVDLDAGVLRLPDSKVGPREIVLPAEVVAILRRLPRSSVYVLPGRLGGPMMGVHDTWYRFLDTLGLHDIRFHDLRRTHGSLALESGLTVRQVADLLGHSDVRSTEVYLVAEGEHAARSVGRVAGEIVRIATGAPVVESITKRRAVSKK